MFLTVIPVRRASSPIVIWSLPGPFPFAVDFAWFEFT